STPLEVAPGTSQIGENAAHQLGTDGQKMGSVLPAYLPHIYQPQVDLIDERGGLQGMACGFAGHIALCRLVQLVVHKRRKLFQRLFVPVNPSAEQMGYFVRGRINTESG